MPVRFTEVWWKKQVQGGFIKLSKAAPLCPCWTFGEAACIKVTDSSAAVRGTCPRETGHLSASRSPAPAFETRRLLEAALPVRLMSCRYRATGPPGRLCCKRHMCTVCHRFCFSNELQDIWRWKRFFSPPLLYNGYIQARFKSRHVSRTCRSGQEFYLCWQRLHGDRTLRCCCRAPLEVAPLTAISVHHQRRMLKDLRRLGEPRWGIPLAQDPVLKASR